MGYTILFVVEIVLFCEVDSNPLEEIDLFSILVLMGASRDHMLANVTKHLGIPSVDRHPKYATQIRG